jgi:hypothetical protein
MRAMLENLRRTLPENRRAELDTELDLLNWAIQTHFSRPEELALARTPDSQGLGGSMRTGTATADIKTRADPSHR